MIVLVAALGADVLATGGVHVGGDDFDGLIMRYRLS